MNKSIIKICGMRDAGNIQEVEKLGPDMIGFIFYPPSPRYVPTVPEYMPAKAKRVGIFVNENPLKVIAVAKRFELNYLQLHGNEDDSCCRKLKASGYGIIKAFPVSYRRDLNRTLEYADACDYFLFDTRSPSVGGSGIKFNWDFLDAYNGQTPFLLSGGISPEDADRLIKLQHPLLAGFDLNSRFETAPAVKSVDKLKTFIDIIRNQQEPN
jgi:phosphoribosylanthranilate isomerase